jgi:hypothetical protein
MNMETRETVLSKITVAKQMAEGLARARPGDAPWPMLFGMLEAYEGQVRDHWPLTAEEREACRLGWFSVRNIEEVFPQLHAALSEVAHGLRHSEDVRS